MAINDNTSYELFGYQVKDLATKIKSKAEAASLAPVATSGLYSDLTGAPTIPTVYNGTLTIQQNGTTVDTFTANSSTNKTVNIETITATTVAPAQQVGAVTSSMIDWSTIKHSAPTTTVLETIGTVTSSRSYTAPSNGFLIGKGVSWANGGQAGVFLTNGDSYMLGGIPYTEYPGNNQVAFCIPVYKGQTVYFRMSGGSSRLEEVRLVASHSEASI